MKLIDSQRWRQQLIPAFTVAVFLSVLAVVVMLGNGVDVFSRIVVVG